MVRGRTPGSASIPRHSGQSRNSSCKHPCTNTPSSWAHPDTCDPAPAPGIRLGPAWVHGEGGKAGAQAGRAAPHWLLPLPAGRRDSSGIRLYYTATLRRFDAGIMELGLVYTPVMAIPPGETDFMLTGYCTDKCTQLVSSGRGRARPHRHQHRHRSSRPRHHGPFLLPVGCPPAWGHGI